MMLSAQLRDHNQGFSLLEILVALAIMGVLGGFVYPTISKWQMNQYIEQDVKAYTDLLDYVASKAKQVNGTGMVYCTDGAVSYKISTYFQKPQLGTGILLNESAAFEAKVVQDPRANDPTHNILSGKTNFLSRLCGDGGSSTPLLMNARGQGSFAGLTSPVPYFFIHHPKDGLTPTLVAGQTITNDNFGDYRSYLISFKPHLYQVSVNVKNPTSGRWQCATDEWRDAIRIGKMC